MLLITLAWAVVFVAVIVGYHRTRPKPLFAPPTNPVPLVQQPIPVTEEKTVEEKELERKKLELERAQINAMKSSLERANKDGRVKETTPTPSP